MPYHSVTDYKFTIIASENSPEPLYRKQISLHLSALLIKYLGKTYFRPFPSCFDPHLVIKEMLRDFVDLSVQVSHKATLSVALYAFLDFAGLRRGKLCAFGPL